MCWGVGSLSGSDGEDSRLSFPGPARALSLCLPLARPRFSRCPRIVPRPSTVPLVTRLAFSSRLCVRGPSDHGHALLIPSPLSNSRCVDPLRTSLHTIYFSSVANSTQVPRIMHHAPCEDASINAAPTQNISKQV